MIEQVKYYSFWGKKKLHSSTNRYIKICPENSKQNRANPLVDKQRRDRSGRQGIIFHFIIPSVVGSVSVSVDRLRYITRARCHHTQGGMCYLLQGRVAWMLGTSAADADLGPGGMLSLTDTCGHSWWLRGVWLLPTSQVSVWLHACVEAPLAASH